jgi:hypothetical protein
MSSNHTNGNQTYSMHTTCPFFPDPLMNELKGLLSIPLLNLRKTATSGCFIFIVTITIHIAAATTSSSTNKSQSQPGILLPIFLILVSLNFILLSFSILLICVLTPTLTHNFILTTHWHVRQTPSQDERTQNSRCWLYSHFHWKS